jgi:hypothetical protein
MNCSDQALVRLSNRRAVPGYLSEAMQGYLTLVDVAGRLGVSIHNVRHWVRTAGWRAVVPDGVASCVRPTSRPSWRGTRGVRSKAGRESGDERPSRRGVCGAFGTSGGGGGATRCAGPQIRGARGIDTGWGAPSTARSTVPDGPQARRGRVASAGLRTAKGGWASVKSARATALPLELLAPRRNSLASDPCLGDPERAARRLIVEIDVTELVRALTDAASHAPVAVRGSEWVEAKTFQFGPRMFRHLAKSGAFPVTRVGRRSHGGATSTLTSNAS